MIVQVGRQVTLTLVRVPTLLTPQVVAQPVAAGLIVLVQLLNHPTLPTLGHLTLQGARFLLLHAPANTEQNILLLIMSHILIPRLSFHPRRVHLTVYTLLLHSGMNITIQLTCILHLAPLYLPERGTQLPHIYHHFTTLQLKDGLMLIILNIVKIDQVTGIISETLCLLHLLLHFQKKGEWCTTYKVAVHFDHHLLMPIEDYLMLLGIPLTTAHHVISLTDGPSHPPFFLLECQEILGQEDR